MDKELESVCCVGCRLIVHYPKLVAIATNALL